MGPVLIESSANSTMPTYPEHLLTPSELGDMVHFSWGVQHLGGGTKPPKERNSLIFADFRTFWTFMMLPGALADGYDVPTYPYHKYYRF